MGLIEIQNIKKRKVPEKKKLYRISPISKKKLALQKEEREKRNGEKTDLQKWYDHIMETNMPVCWETADRIDIWDRKGWRGSIAHVLPKKAFRSVATHPENYMILKMWGGTHDLYDASWQSAMKMKVWPHALEIIKKLYPLLTEKEKSKLPDVIFKQIKKEETESRA